MSSDYFEDQQARRLVMAAYYTDWPDLPSRSPYIGFHFGVVAEFVQSSMRGKFDDMTVILMGCNGLTSNTLARASVERGAKEVMNWSDLVSAAHTDAATEHLLEHLPVGGLSAEEVAAQTMAELGPDQFFDSVLLSYPPEG